jgi:hypothetical protein
MEVVELAAAAAAGNFLSGFCFLLRLFSGLLILDLVLSVSEVGLSFVKR